MKRLLILAPNFQPADAVDMHRVRMNVGHYRRGGWDPTILAVEPRLTGRAVDQSLLQTVPADICVRRTAAIPAGLGRIFGVSDIALRAYGHLRAAGDAAIRRETPDLVFISTTAFLTMPLGPRWQREFGVPFVLDFQDPWSTAPPSTAQFRRAGLKHGLMRRLHARAEARSAPFASGLISVSETYLECLQAAYPSLERVPAETIPFGFAPEDFEVAEREGRVAEPFGPGRGPSPACIYAGRIAPAMERSLKTFLTLLATAKGDGPLARLHAAFIGTGYQQSGNPSVTAAEVARLGLSARVAERPERLRLLDVLKTLSTAQALLILGSDDLAYQPSKLYQCLSLSKPVICVAPVESRLASLVAGLRSVVYIPTGPIDADAAKRADEALGRLLADNAACAEPARTQLARNFSASALAARECALFDRALNYAQSTA